MKVSKNIYADLGLPHAASDWIRIAKLVIARFVRGNTAAQFASILLPSEQAAQRHEAEIVAGKWADDYAKSKRHR